MKIGRIAAVTLGVLLLALAGAALTLGIVWWRFEPPAVVGSTVADQAGDLEQVTESWLTGFFADLDGWRVPPTRRISGLSITGTEDLGDGFVQIDFTFRTMLSDPHFSEGFEQCAVAEGKRSYSGQLVLHWQACDQGWEITEAMRPAAWQLAYDPDIQAEREQPQTEHYNAATYRGLPYLIEDETLFVTYDGGETYLEVPDGYELVCAQDNGAYLERLGANSYIVTPDLTAFLTYEAGSNYQQVYLLYSKDEGQTWQHNLIGDGYRANSFLSQTESGVYATFGAERLTGSDYYQTLYSADLDTWTSIDLPAHDRNYTCVYWRGDGVGYYSGGTIEASVTQADGTQSVTTLTNVFYATFDNGASYTQLTFPEEESVTQTYGFFPFDTLDEMYEADGTLYLVVGQGDDGDVTEDGAQVKARYASADGETFTFVETFADPVVLAG